MATEAQKRANRKYYEKSKKFFKAVLLRFSREQDADVLAKLDSVPNKTDYVRKLVRKDI